MRKGVGGLDLGGRAQPEVGKEYPDVVRGKV